MKSIFLLLFTFFTFSLVYGQAPEMVTVAGGSFNMGSDDGDIDAKPTHIVTVNSFRMSKFEITINDFAAFIDATGYQTDAEKQGFSYVYIGKWQKAKGVNCRFDEEGQRRVENDGNKPVIHISWNDAKAYCDWLSKFTGKPYRLPTEAEWEYAAGNGPRHSKYSWGNDIPSKDEPFGNVADETAHPKYGAITPGFKGYTDGYFFSAPAGSYNANDFGLYDMTGNVQEWCNDWYDAAYYATSPGNNPQGPVSGGNKVIRGGSWMGNPASSKVTNRDSHSPDYRCYDIGFRVVMTI